MGPGDSCFIGEAQCSEAQGSGEGPQGSMSNVGGGNRGVGKIIKYTSLCISTVLTYCNKYSGIKKK